MRCLVSLLLLLALSGCSAMKPIMPSCDDPQPYQGSAEIASLKVPAGVDQPNTRTALRIPDVKTPEQPRQAGRCLEEPPVAPTRAQMAAGAGAATATAAAVPPAAPSGSLDFGSGAGRQWETRLGAVYQLSESADFEGGTTADFNSDYGFLVGVGWRLADRLTLGTNLSYDSRHYHASMAGDEAGEALAISGSLDSMGLMVDLTYDFMSGPLTPFVVAGVGWNWVDTNIATAPPEVGCWWNPWYGYICTTFQDTKTIDGFGYQVGAGLRYDINEAFSLSGSYKMSWVDFPSATSTPSFGGVHLILGWRF